MEDNSLNDDVWAVIHNGGYLNQLQQIWNDLGYEDELIIQRKEIVCKHTQDLYKQMVEEERDCKDKLIKRIKNSLNETAKLNKELNVDIDVAFDESMPLIPLYVELRKRLHKYQKMKAEQLKRFGALQEREKVLCHALGIHCQPHDVTSLPSDEEIQRFTKYLEEKSEERDRLQIIFRETRVAIIAIMNEFDITPELEFEKLVVSGNSFQFSKENMRALKDLHQSLERRVEDTKATTEQLREKLVLLWERLHEPHDVRSNFSSTYTGYSSATVRALKEEINRCDEKRRINIKKIVEKVRLELMDWWEKCYFSEAEKNAFTHIKNTSYTVDLLELHEHEVNKLKKLYDNNIDIFSLIKEHQDLWKRRAVLEENAHHPLRLFQNRGGELLREEKERKTINKDLPKIESEIKKLAAAYEAAEGKPFFVFGESVINYLQHQMENLERAKEMEKQARKARNQTDATMSSCKSIVAVGKRKGCAPSPAEQKRQRTLGSSNKPSNAPKTSAQRPVRAIGKDRENRSRQKKVAKRMFNEMRESQNHDNLRGIPKTPDMSAAASNLTYTDFQVANRMFNEMRESQNHDNLRGIPETPDMSAAASNLT